MFFFLQGDIKPKKVQVEGVFRSHADDTYRKLNMSKLKLIVLIYHMNKYIVPLGSIILSPERLSV